MGFSAHFIAAHIKRRHSRTVRLLIAPKFCTHHKTDENDIFRQVVGFDSSSRFPFILTHSFLGDRPITVDFTRRTRYVSSPEHLTDYVSEIAERIMKQQRSDWRGSYIIPISTLANFKVTAQHGGLPPDFNYLGSSLNVGRTFSIPGYSEH
jgi:hypothetical protein